MQMRVNDMLRSWCLLAERSAHNVRGLPSMIHDCSLIERFLWGLWCRCILSEIRFYRPIGEKSLNLNSYRLVKQSRSLHYRPGSKTVIVRAVAFWKMRVINAVILGLGLSLRPMTSGLDLEVHGTGLDLGTYV